MNIQMIIDDLDLMTLEDLFKLQRVLGYAIEKKKLKIRFYAEKNLKLKKNYKNILEI